MKKYAFSYPILLKLAGFEKEALSNATTYGLGGAAAGALLGALVDRKKRLRGALLGALVGGAGGYGLGYQRDYVSDRKQKDEANRQTMRRDASRAAHRKAFDERLDAADRELARYGLEPEFRPEYSDRLGDYNDDEANWYIDRSNRRIAKLKGKTPVGKEPTQPEASVPSAGGTSMTKQVDKPVTVKTQPETRKDSPVAAPGSAPTSKTQETVQTAKNPVDTVKQSPARGVSETQKKYAPPKYVLFNRSTGEIKKLDFNTDNFEAAVKRQFDEVHKHHGITDGRFYRDDRGIRHDIYEDVIGQSIPTGFDVKPTSAVDAYIRDVVQPQLDRTTDMGQRYKLKGIIEALIKDKARAESAVKDAIGQYTPFGGKVTADSELVKEINLALANNAGNPEGLKKALTEIAYKMPMKPEDEGNYRMMPLRVNVPTGGGRITVEKQGPGNHISEDTVKQILKLLSE